MTVSTHILTCHIAQNPIDILREVFTNKKFYEIYSWDLDIGIFFKSKALLWSKQICTQNTVLVIHHADKISVPMMSLITGMLDQGFSRPIVFVVQSEDRLPFSIRRKSKVINAHKEPELASGWESFIPDVRDHLRWEDLLLR